MKTVFIAQSAASATPVVGDRYIVNYGDGDWYVGQIVGPVRGTKAKIKYDADGHEETVDVSDKLNAKHLPGYKLKDKKAYTRAAASALVAECKDSLKNRAKVVGATVKAALKRNGAQPKLTGHAIAMWPILKAAGLKDQTMGMGDGEYITEAQYKKIEKALENTYIKSVHGDIVDFSDANGHGISVQELEEDEKDDGMSRVVRWTDEAEVDPDSMDRLLFKALGNLRKKGRSTYLVKKIGRAKTFLPQIKSAVSGNKLIEWQDPKDPYCGNAKSDMEDSGERLIYIKMGHMMIAIGEDSGEMTIS